MADKTYGTLVTDCGIQLIAAAVMEGKKINITDLAVGDGGGSYYKPNSTMTALKGEKWRGKVNRVEINEKSPNMIDVVAVIESGSPHYNRIEESRRGGNARRFSWGAACSVQLLQRPQRQFLWRDELEQRLQRQQRRSPALVETAIE